MPNLYVLYFHLLLVRVQVSIHRPLFIVIYIFFLKIWFNRVDCQYIIYPRPKSVTVFYCKILFRCRIIVHSLLSKYNSCNYYSYSTNYLYFNNNIIYCVPSLSLCIHRYVHILIQEIFYANENVALKKLLYFFPMEILIQINVPHLYLYTLCSINVHNVQCHTCVI